MSIQVFSSDDPKENTGLADTKITDTIEEEKMMNSDMKLIKVMEENEEEKNHYQLGNNVIYIDISSYKKKVYHNKNKKS